jgi:aldehyde:ferredoxin oxidoreductase
MGNRYGGYTGKILYVDLSKQKVKEETLDDTLYTNFLGGVGLGAKILYERMKANVDPLGPDNVIGFVPGLLTGTPVPLSPRYAVVAKSPLTYTWGDANSGGYFGPELKKAGYDAVFFTGISAVPVYLLIQDGHTELKDATKLWGKDTVETQDIIRRELGDQATRVVCIGPSGESLSLIAAVINDEGRAAARSGLAAVMGAKRLKAIAVRGTQKPLVADVKKLNALKQSFGAHHRSAKPFQTFKKYGTPSFTAAIVPLGDVPFKNWSLFGEEAMPSCVKLGADEVIKYQVKRYGCSGCPIACGGIFEISKGPYAVSDGSKPEYETVAGLGTMCLIDNVEAVIKANDICNRYGLDTMSTGAAIAFAMECYENGIIGKDETGGIDLTWGNAQAMVAMTEKIAKREGLGNVLADGVKRAAEQIGKGAEKYAIHIHGQEVGYHTPMFNRGRCAGYVTDATPGRHTAGIGMSIAENRPIGLYPELQITNQDKNVTYAIASCYSQAVSAGGICFFTNMSSEFPFVEFMSAVTGWDFSTAEAIKIGKRIITLRQAFNVRDGIHPGDFNMPERLTVPLSVGPAAGRITDVEALKRGYYEVMDWDISTGKPSPQVLKELDLESLVGSL